ncbi:hypothetical protein N7G274_001960 [Stereocaulon virgatum]|uniref:Uncharacterized protein n=1 Tax=Stereocaulon virgatum TaxID=373712 RepID=A0ABR4AIC8_9LECA
MGAENGGVRMEMLRVMAAANDMVILIARALIVHGYGDVDFGDIRVVFILVWDVPKHSAIVDAISHCNSIQTPVSGLDCLRKQQWSARSYLALLGKTLASQQCRPSAWVRTTISGILQ